MQNILGIGSSNLKHLRFFVLTALFSLFATYLAAQSLNVLKERLSKAENPKQKVDAYNALANLNWDIDFSEGRLYTDSAFKLATEIEYEKGLVEANINKGLAEYSIQDFRKAFEYFEMANKSALEIQEFNLINYTHNLIANLLIIQGEFLLAEEYLKKLEPNIKKGTIHDASYSATLARLFYEQGYTNYAESAILRAYRIRIDSGYTNLLASTAALIAKIKTDQAKYQEAETYFLKALDYANETGHLLRTGRIYIEFAEKKILTGSYDSAILLVDHAFKIFDEGGVEIGRMMAYKKYSEYYLEVIDYVKAHEYAIKALQIAEQIGAKKMQADIYLALAWIYKDENNFELSLDYLNRALTLQQSIGYKRGESGTYNILGNIYNLKNELNRALDYFDKALEIRKENGYLRGQASILYNIGLIKEKQGELRSAKEYVKKSVEINLQIGHATGLAYEYNTLASIELKEKNVKAATQYLDNALSSAKKYNNIYNLSRSYKLLSQIHESKGDYKKALEFNRLYETLNDSLFNIARSKQILELQSKFELQSKDQEIALLNAKNESAELLMDFQNAIIEKQRTYIISISIGLILMVLIAYILFKYYQSQSRSNELLQTLNEEISQQKEDLRVANEKVVYVNQKLEAMVRERTEKLRTAYHELDTFFYKSSHDFRRPITTFLGLAEVARYTVKDQQALELFEKVKETAINIDKMLAKLQSISYVGSQELVYKSVFFEGIIQSLLGGFDDQLKAKEVDLNYEIKLTENFVSYPLYVSIILENLIENAIVFNTSTIPKIDIFIQKSEEGKLEINVTDNGVGIQEEYQSKIFEMYYRGNDKSKGNGLGLYIVKKAVEKLRGNISFNSVHPGGTTFTVLLPFN